MPSRRPDRKLGFQLLCLVERRGADAHATWSHLHARTLTHTGPNDVACAGTSAPRVASEGFSGDSLALCIRTCRCSKFAHFFFCVCSPEQHRAGYENRLSGLRVQDVISFIVHCPLPTIVTMAWMRGGQWLVALVCLASARVPAAAPPAWALIDREILRETWNATPATSNARMAEILRRRHPVYAPAHACSRPHPRPRACAHTHTHNRACRWF